MSSTSPPSKPTRPQAGPNAAQFQSHRGATPEALEQAHSIPISRFHSHFTRVGPVSRLAPQDLSPRFEHDTTRLTRLESALSDLRVTQNNLRQAIEDEVRRTVELDGAATANAGMRSDIQTWMAGTRMGRWREEHATRVGRQAQVLRELETRLRVAETELEERLAARGWLLGSIEATRERMRECGIEVPEG